MRPTDITEDSNHAGVEVLSGFSMRETGAAAAVTVTFRKAAVGGQVLLEVNLAAGESATFIVPRGKEIPSEGGVYVQTTGTGVLTGVIYE